MLDSQNFYMPNFIPVKTNSQKMIVISTCVFCGKGFIYDSNVYKTGSKESKFCKECKILN